MATSDDHWGRQDRNTAVREYLQQLYGVTNPDVQTLIERFRIDFVHHATVSDDSNFMVYLEKCARGQETSALT